MCSTRKGKYIYKIGRFFWGKCYIANVRLICFYLFIVQPDRPQVWGASPTTIHVKWKPPNCNGAPIIYYYLLRRESEFGDFTNPIKFEVKNLEEDQGGYYDVIIEVISYI